MANWNMTSSDLGITDTPRWARCADCGAALPLDDPTWMPYRTYDADGDIVAYWCDNCVPPDAFDGPPAREWGR